MSASLKDLLIAVACVLLALGAVLALPTPAHAALPEWSRPMSDCGDVEPIAEFIELPRLELFRFQLAKPAALEDGVGKPLVHLP